LFSEATKNTSRSGESKSDATTATVTIASVPSISAVAATTDNATSSDSSEEKQGGNFQKKIDLLSFEEAMAVPQIDDQRIHSHLQTH
jgi:hypothetical protein